MELKNTEKQQQLFERLSQGLGDTDEFFELDKNVKKDSNYSEQDIENIANRLFKKFIKKFNLNENKNETNNKKIQLTIGNTTLSGDLKFEGDLSGELMEMFNKHEPIRFRENTDKTLIIIDGKIFTGKLYPLNS